MSEMYQVVLETPNGLGHLYKRYGAPVETVEEAILVCGAAALTGHKGNYKILAGADEEAIDRKYEFFERGAYTSFLIPEASEINRAICEMSDRDPDEVRYHFSLPRTWIEQKAWLQMQSQVACGKIGGPDDGVHQPE